MILERHTPSPPSDNTNIWRYMPDWKFTALLSTYGDHGLWCDSPMPHTKHFNEPGQLWFGLPRAFTDEMEGAFPVINEDPVKYCDRMAAQLGLPDAEARERKARFLDSGTETILRGVLAMAQLCGVTCWHESDDECDRMWKEYVGDKDGVAIKTTVGQLERALTHAHNSPARCSRPAFTSVGYIDYESFFLSQDGFYNLLCLKGNGFRHENEIRVIAKSPWLCKVPLQHRQPFPPDPHDWPRFIQQLRCPEKAALIAQAVTTCQNTLAPIESHDKKGFNLPIALDGLLSEVIVKPGSSDEFLNSVKTQLIAVGMDHVTVHTSQCDENGGARV